MKTYLIDASLLKESDCDLKTHLIHDRGFTTSLDSFKMQYGTAGHKALALYYSGRPITECLKVAIGHYFNFCTQPPPGDFRTIEHLADTLSTYFKHFPRESDPLKVSYSPIDPQKTLVEIPFIWPYYKDSNMEVFLTGTTDFIGTYCGEKCFVDWKFTSVRDKESYFKGFQLDIQPKFYSYIFKLTGIYDFYLPCVIGGFFLHAPDRRMKNPVCKTEFVRSSLISFTEESMQDFKKWLELRIEHITRNTDYLPNENRCKTIYGFCQFFTHCILKKEYREEYMMKNFEIRHYDPLLFQV